MARRVSESFPSKYFRADDLKGRRRTLTIDHVQDEELGRGHDATEKPVVYFREDPRGLALNKTNAVSIQVNLGSEDYDDWTGKTITLYPTTTRDPNGKKVPCIRIVEKLAAGELPAVEPAVDEDEILLALEPSGKKAS